MQPSISTKSDNVYDLLVERIRNGVWPLQSVIPSEVDLANELGCSRTTMGKALARLVYEGFVVRKRRAGTRVVSLSPGRGRSNVELDAVAFIFPSEQHDGIRRIGQGFQEAAHAVGRRIVMLSTGTDYRKEGEIVGRLDEFDVKGAVVYPVLPEPRDRVHFEQMLLKCRFPVVLAMALPGLGRVSVDLDGFHAGWTMTRYLLGRGLKRIGFLATYAWVPSVRESFLGYRQAMEEANISIQSNWTSLDPAIRPDFERPLAAGGGFVGEFLQQAGDLEGVVCSDDFLALLCVASAHEQGISVPDQLKVAGISDYAISAQSNPPLTTYHLPFEEIGRQSFETLNGLLQSGNPSEREIQLRGTLVERQSA